VHGVLSIGAHLTSNVAVTVAAPALAALNTAVADLPEGLQESPRTIELSEMVGGQRLHLPEPLDPALESKVTVSVAPTRTQIDPISPDCVYATFPDAQVDWVTWVAGGGATPSETVRLTGA
jgi:hypothetical protein